MDCADLQTVKCDIFTTQSSKTTSSYKEDRGAEAAVDRGEIRYWFIDNNLFPYNLVSSVEIHRMTNMSTFIAMKKFTFSYNSLHLLNLSVLEELCM